MDWFWTWGGECFGYRRDDRLFAYHGLQVGKFHEDEVYGSDGRYLGEIKSGNRLITNIGKKSRIQFSFMPVQGGSYARYTNYVGYVMYAGYEDFPSPDDF
ncbi:MAG: hypothetical protein OXI73_15835 [Rhodospirillales bacterium]|nr:hypothetical protein [Rhodospirillales bacterium]